ncbi:MAG: Ger(x)C family spore germination protein [Bacillota bacterium]
MKKCLLIHLCIISLLTGCWDQNLLVNKKLINGISFDLTEDDEILLTTRALSIQSKGGGQFEINDELVQATRPTVAGLAIDIDNKLPGKLDISKAHIVIIGEDIAKKGIHPLLEGMYRPKDSYITAKIVMGKGKASDILSTEPEKSPIAFDILQGLKAAENTNLIPEENIITTWTKVVDSGKDSVLPYLEKVESNKIEIAGVALLHGDKFTGTTLLKDQSKMLLLLMKELKKISYFAMVLNQENKAQSIGFTAKSMKRNLDLKVDKKSHQIVCKIDLKLDIKINTYPQEFDKKVDIEKLHKDLSEELTNQAKNVTNTLLEANCDALGIGSRIASLHPDLWKQIDWEEEYKNVQFEPNVKVNIINTGTIY